MRLHQRLPESFANYSLSVAYTIIPFIFQCIDRKSIPPSPDQGSLAWQVDEQNDSIWIQHAIGPSGINCKDPPRQFPMPSQSCFNFANPEMTAYYRIVQYFRDLLAKFERNGQSTEPLHDNRPSGTSDFSELVITWDPSPTPSASWLDSMENFFFGVTAGLDGRC